jgi:hypothetical protein
MNVTSKPFLTFDISFRHVINKIIYASFRHANPSGTDPANSAHASSRAPAPALPQVGPVWRGEGGSESDRYVEGRGGEKVGYL